MSEHSLQRFKSLLDSTCDNAKIYHPDIYQDILARSRQIITDLAKIFTTDADLQLQLCRDVRLTGLYLHLQHLNKISQTFDDNKNTKEYIVIASSMTESIEFNFDESTQTTNLLPTPPKNASPLSAEEKKELSDLASSIDDADVLFAHSLKYFDWKNKRLRGIDYYDRELTKRVLPFLEKGAKMLHPASMHSLGEYYSIFEINRDEALALFISSAEKNYTDAYISIGEHYYDKRNLEECRVWWKKAAENGNGRGYHQLGRWHYEIDKDYKKARDYWEKAVEFGYPTSYNSLAVYYDVYERRPDIYIPLYFRAIELGYAGAWSNLGMYFQNMDQDRRTAQMYYYKASLLGNAHGMICLGYSLYEINKMVALEWYEHAAYTGTANSLHQMGGWYEDENDLDKAKEYYQKALVKNWGKSFFRLAQASLKSNNDEEVAEKYYEKGAELGDPWCIYELAKCRVQRETHEKNVVFLPVARIEEIFSRTIKLGEPDQVAALGEFFYKLWVAIQDRLELMENESETEAQYYDYKTKTLEYWLQAVCMGSEENDVFYAIGFYYDVINSDWPSAKPWYLRAAARNHAEALFRLGQHSSQIENDIPHAVEFLRKAAQIGHEGSKKLLERLESQTVMIEYSVVN